MPEDEDFLVPIGVSDVKREGDDVTIVSYSKMLQTSLEAADQLAEEGIEAEVIKRFADAGVETEKMSFLKDTYIFNYAGPPSGLVETFRRYYGPTMNAFEAAEKNGRAGDLQRELDELFNGQNKSSRKDATSIPATFLRVTVAVS